MAQILILGAAGMLGRDLQRETERRGIETSPMDVAECDVTKPADCERTLEAIRPEIVINCAAWTNVASAEHHPEETFAINAEGAGNVARACAHALCRCIYLSTDFVFDGTKNAPYLETDAPNPVNTYGKSKLEGERRVSFSAPNHAIIRTAWLYGQHGPNFVRSILALRHGQRPVEVVNDQMGSPTWTRHLARAILDIALSKETGIFHATNSGSCTRDEQARLIFELAGTDPDLIHPAPTSPDAVPQRPADSRLSCDRLSGLMAEPMPDWATALEEFLTEIGQRK
ncbi:dTDP-4-dehydrorhamnose reductase [candidate division BRC1 bacterium HGW-BRC1-1]|nr:MAG: dTDP-4-dehydrorhamnose reductase [candidate division BRC1 bacterium HGW-BRC1-1]